SSRRRHTRCYRDWSSDVCSSDLRAYTSRLLSPDGRRLVYARRSDAHDLLYARDLATGAERVLSRELPRDDQEGFAQMDVLPASAFTPDGRSYLYWSGGKIHRRALAIVADAIVPLPADLPP